MGDIADMMLDGTLCAGCGELLDETGEGAGFPQYCGGCLVEMGPNHTTDEPFTAPKRAKVGPPKPQPRKPLGCPQCAKTFWTKDSYNQHWQTKHRPKS